MKFSAYSYLAAALLIIPAVSACQADMDNPGLQIPVATMTPNTSILELKQQFENTTEKIPAKENGDHYIIHGRVVSSDATGNIYKSLVIQDETAALAFSINQTSLFNEYRLGQEMVVDVTDLYIGYYRGLQQIGTPNDPYNGTPQLGFMAYDFWLEHAQCNGLPKPDYKNVSLNDDYPTDEYYCIVFNSFDELTNASLPELQSQFVEFRNVSFDIKEGEETYAPYEESVNRTLVDANGQTLTVRNSGYSNFYNTPLPEGRGNVRGILSYYSGDTPWQLVLRSLDDVMITTKGEESDPFSVEDLSNPDFAGLSGWVKGYIVGSVKAGITVVSSPQDAIFGPDAEMDNNLIIAENPDETDLAKCAVVQLPQMTQLRFWANLLDNPDVYKKELLVKGEIGTDLGLPAVIDSRGGFDDFKIDGKSLSGGSEAPDPAGAGTEADPYNVSFVMQSANDMTDVWVEGYVAGYVADGNFADGAHFAADEVPNSTNYLNSTNIILSAVAPMKCGVANSIPAQLTSASRPTLGLRLNPTVYGKRVKVKCRIADYLGTRGIRNISEVVVL